ncbi:hypothetical protein K491DRAFT_713662 [Lophiostoma macrostomum CBS 122681]|uniref:HMG box domain-containing protein n=1 Tax=Lophiostoma macrostomum CBS 122681 TaxID=1314788 RepID=A0A6A6TEJ1_9PLEO|nr:hypothetical protein K491DRAFT_713662 [Lophiostoma macrostomum CBS 122681]
MSDLRRNLERLGLSQYLDIFVAEGFDTWETILDITESDLNALNVKLGHRRRLQRAIAESRGQSAERSLPIVLSKAGSVDNAYRSDDSAPETKGKRAETSAPGNTGTSTKRKYRRHPKTDEHAPERPPSAYVIFSNQVRETLRGRDLSFTEIAKVVGERWQVLPADAREACERQANAAKDKYYAELVEYKKTPEYEAYQRYLEDFKAKHAAPQKETEGKRSRLETETSFSTTRSNSHEAEHSGSRRVSSAQVDPFAMNHYRSGSSPPIGPARLPSAPLYLSKPPSPTLRPLTGLSSPPTGEQYSPTSVSPRTSLLQKEFEPNSSALGRDPRGQADATLPFHPQTYAHHSQLSSPMPSAMAYPSYYQQAPVDLPSRRTFREPTRLPPLTHEDTTLSSDSGGSYPPPSMMPAMGAEMSKRILPQPVPSVPSTAVSDRPFPGLSHTPQRSFESQHPAPLAALLRATELASQANEAATGKEASP